MAATAHSLGPAVPGLITRLWQSSVGKKYVMAISGLGLYVFVIGHLLGNLQIYLGPEKINNYAAFLKSNLALLWSARIGLLVLAVLHVTAGIQLALANRRARPVAYTGRKPVASTLANRTMIFSGLIILAFVLFHLAHFTFGLVNSGYLQFEDPLGRHDVYRMMIVGFSNPLVTVFYLLSMGLLLLHLSHGVSSIFQSLGLRSKKTFGALDWLAKISSILIFLGNCSIPLAILAGVVK
ncbi:MAG TPA: succinate dehydrogenase cytochrome b subunit [Blastocatellia bacterium]|nr:succinate dehydrogenase cytochrome b subunit [Blastocatellia bacterium]